MSDGNIAVVWCFFFKIVRTNCLFRGTASTRLTVCRTITPMLLFLPAFAFQTFLSLLDVGEREPPSSSSPTPFQRSSSQSVSLGVNPNSLTRSLTQFCFWRVLQSVSREYAWKVVPHSVRNFMEETLKPPLSLSLSLILGVHSSISFLSCFYSFNRDLEFPNLPLSLSFSLTQF